MSYIFISHSSSNDFEAIAIQDWLMSEGWDDLFLDIDPKRGIVAGERWEKALHDAANRCDAVLFLVTKHWIDSPWCRKEFRLAHRMNKRVIGLLIEDLDLTDLPEELTSTWQLVNLASGTDHQLVNTVHPTTGEQRHISFSSSGLTRLRTGLVKAGLDARFFEWPPTDDLNRPPFRGMQPLEAEDAGIFYGREAPTIDLLAKLRGLRSTPSPRFLVILGASGAGKSSFLRAGILPRLTRDEEQFLPLPIIRPEQSVLWGDVGLLKSLDQCFKDFKLNINRGTIRQAIEHDTDALIDMLKQLSKSATASVFGDSNQKPPTFVISIDQAEELFQSEGIDESVQFLDLIKHLTTQVDVPVIVLSTIRSDAYERLQTAKALEGISQQTFSLSPMPTAEFKQIIEGPAKRLDESDRPLLIEPKLTQAILEDIEKGSGKDALPLLAFTLERLYLDYGSDGDLTLDEYQHMGRIEGAIEAAVEQAFKAAYKEPKLPKDKTALKSLLRRGLIPWLAGIDPDTQAPRRRVAKIKEIPAEARPMIDLLIEKRLLSTDVDEETKEITIEPAHEALLRQWGLLQGWLEEDFTALSTLEGLQRASRDWEANNTTDEWLTHNAGRLEDAQNLLLREDLSSFLSSTDKKYLKACQQREQALRNKELNAQRKIVRRTTLGMIVAIILTIIAGFLGWQANESAILAEQSKLEALISAEQAKEQAKRADESALKAQQQSKRADESSQLAQLKEQQAIQHSKAAIRNSQLAQIEKNKALLTQSQFLLDQAAQENNKGNYDTALLLGLNAIPGAYGGDRPIPQNQFELQRSIKLSNKKAIFLHNTNVNSAFYSPDNKQVATLNDDFVTIWSTATGKRLLNIDQSYTKFAQYSHDSQFLLMADGHNVSVWNPQTGKQLYTLKHDSKVKSAQFNHDSTIMVTGTINGQVSVWSLKNNKKLSTYSHSKAVNTVEFNTDSRFILSASDDNSVIVWDLKEQHQAEYFIHRQAVTKAKFSPNSDYVATISNKEGKVWSLDSSNIKFEISASNMLNDIVFSPDSTQLLVVGDAEDTHIYAIETEKQIDEFTFKKDDEEFNAGAFSDDQKLIALASDNNRVLVLSLDGAFSAKNLYHLDKVNTVVFQSDNTQLLSASDDNQAILWTLNEPSKNSGDEILNDDITGLTFTFNAEQTMAAKGFSKAYLWDTTNNEKPTELENIGTFLNFQFSPDSRYLNTISSDHSTLSTLWLTETGQKLRSVKYDYTLKVLPIFYNNSEHVIRIGSSASTLIIESLKKGEELFNIKKETSISSIAYDPTHQKIALSTAYDISIASALNGKHILTITQAGDNKFLHFSPDGNWLISQAKDNQFTLFSSNNNEPVFTYTHDDIIHDIRFSQDSKNIILSSKNDQSILLSTSSNVPVFTFSHAKSMQNFSDGQSYYYKTIFAKFSPDGNTILTASNDRTLSLWSRTTGQKLQQFKHNDNSKSVIFADFSLDSQSILSATTFNNYKWAINYKTNTLKSAKSSLPKNRTCLSPVERKQFFLAELSDLEWIKRRCSQYAKSIRIDAIGSEKLPIVLAIKNNDFKLFTTLLTPQVGSNTSSDVINSALFQAVKDNRFKFLSHLLTYNVNINIIDEKGNSLLHIASKNKRDEKNSALMVQTLIDAGAHINATNELGSTALYLSVLNNRPLSFKTLLANKPDVNIANTDGWNSLTAAIDEGYMDMMQSLIFAGASPNVSDSDGWTPLHLSVNSSNKGSDQVNADMAQLLIDVGANINATLTSGKTPLYLALSNHRPITFKTLLNAKADVNMASNDGWSPLHLTVDSSNKGTDANSALIAQALIDAGANINATLKTGGTPLYLAVLNSKPITFKTLLKANADVNLASNKGWTPLHLTVDRNNKSSDKDNEVIAQALINAGAHINALTSNDVTPLYLSILNNRPLTFKTLLSKNADVNLASDNGWTPLHLTVDGDTQATDQENALMAQALINAGAHINAEINAGRTPLYLSVLNSRPITFKTLLTAKANVNSVNENGWTPLHLTVDADNKGSDKDNAIIAQALIDAGANINAKTKYNSTPLYLSILNSRPITSNILLKANADVNIANENGWTPLHLTVDVDNKGSDKDNAIIARTLIKQGAHINATLNSGETALHLSISNNRPITFNVLLSLNADANLAKNDGWSPLAEAINLGNSDLVERLLTAGASPNTRNSDGWSPLHLTVNKSNKGSDVDNANIALLLINAGADINAKTNEGSTALYLSILNKRPITYKALLQANADVNLSDNNQWSPLHLTVDKDNDASDQVQAVIAQSLIDAGANINLQLEKGESPLYLSVINNRPITFNVLIKAKAKLNLAKNNQWNPLLAAIDEGNVAMVQTLLTAGASLDVKTKDSWLPLHLTVNNNNKGSDEDNAIIAQALLDAGVDINALTNKGSTALNIAVENNRLATFKVLLAANADVNIANKSGWSPLSSAINDGYMTIANALLAAGASTNMTDSTGWTPLHLTVNKSNKRSDADNATMAQALIDAGANINAVLDSGDTPLYLSVNNNRPATFKVLLAAKPNVDLATTDGWNPISAAINDGYITMVQALLTAGASINIKDAEGWTPLHLTVNKSNKGSDADNAIMAQALIDKGANINAALNKGSTALYLSVTYNRPITFNTLLKASANINKAKNNGMTPLMSAISYGHTNMAQTLLEAGALSNVTNEDGLSALHYISLKNTEGSAANKLLIAKQLIANKANINALSATKQSPLHIAVANNKSSIISLLISQKANLNQQDDKGLTPLMIAVNKHHYAIVAKLLDKKADIGLKSINGLNALNLALAVEKPSLIQQQIIELLQNYQQ